MTAKSISFGAPFAWLTASVESLRTDSATLFGATALLMTVAFVPVLINQLLRWFIQPMTLGTTLAIQAVFSLFGMVSFPPVLGGYFRVLRARAQGQPVRATDVFVLFREPATAGRMIAISLIFVAISAAVLLAANFATGGYMIDLFKIAITAVPGKPPIFPAPPSGFGLWWLLCGFLGVVAMTANNLAIPQAALGSRSSIDAVGDGFVATLRNLAVFFVFFVAMLVAGMIFAIIFGLVVGLLIMVSGFVSPILTVVLLVPIYLATMLVIYAVMFGFVYQAWRDTLGSDKGHVEQHIVA
jgi:hypothetical protein